MSLIGAPAYEAYAVLLLKLKPAVASVSLSTYSEPPEAAARAQMRTEDLELLERARSVRAQVGVPFWDAVVLEALKIGKMSDPVVQALTYHQSDQGEITVLSRHQISQGGIERAVADRPTSRVSVLSSVDVDGGHTLHVPLLDFRCDVTPSNLELVLAVSDVLADGPFLILESGSSYHLVVGKMVEYEQLVVFLARALLFGPVVDRSYIAHQLQEHRAALRISGGPAARVPAVVHSRGF